MNDELKIGGYLFGTAADAQLAKEEVEKIKYLNSNMNYANIAKVLQLYDRALDTKMFRTPIGLDYLHSLRRMLLDEGYLEDELRPIPLYTVFARPDNDAPMVQKIKPSAKKQDPYKRKYFTSVIICVILVITIVIMFVIAMTSDTPNMINYRNAIVNEYASWEQDIKQREDAVRAKERELNIVSPLPHEQHMGNSEDEQNGEN